MRRYDVEIAPPRAGEVRVAVKHCGLCHSDVHIADGMVPARRPLSQINEAVKDLQAGRGIRTVLGM